MMHGDVGRFGKCGWSIGIHESVGKYEVMYGDAGSFGKCGVMYWEM